MAYYTETDQDDGPEDDGPEDASEAHDMKMSDEELLGILMAEKQASIGFENASELTKKRTMALEYIKGEMPDVPHLPNRSKAVSTEVADAIETILPDLIEIFTGGEDIAAFCATGEEDEAGAKQETEYVNYVAFQKLGGFLLLYTAIKDALATDTGIIETWWEDNEATKEETFQGITAIQLEMLAKDGYDITEQESLGAGPDGVETFNVEASYKYDAGCIKSANIDPSNLGVCSDATIDLDKAAYVVTRSYPRAYALLDMGFDRKLVDQLPEYAHKSDTQTERARDLASENSTNKAGANHTMRTVEVLKHWIRVDADGDGKSELWRVQTDEQCSIILDKRKVDRVGLAVGTPFINTHRFYGGSLAEKLVEIQRIKTALLRMMLDSGYFAMNQRVEVADDKANENTMPDLLRNEPGSPVRVRQTGAVTPIHAGQLGFDVQMALEYVSTLAEQRSGVVRNAQGLNPDTLHDTAKGALALMTMAQKRVRMIARVFAETLVKKWFLDIHALSRKHATRQEKVRLSGSWTDIDPGNFGDRADMVIEVGVGAGGRDHEMQVMSQILDFQRQAIELSGGPNPLVGLEHVAAALKRFAERAGLKSPELFFGDPAKAKAEPEPPKPDPEMAKVEQDGKIKQAQMQQDSQHRQAELAMTTQAKQAEMQQRTQMDHQKAQTDMEINAARIQMELQLARERAAQELQLAREKMTQEAQLAREQMQYNHTAAMHSAEQQALTATTISTNRPGGKLDQ